MPNRDPILFSQLVTVLLAMCSLGIIVHLCRLKFSDLRKKQRMARAGEQFGLIQTIVGSGKPRGDRIDRLHGSPRVAQSSVTSLDTSVKRWTAAASAGFTPFQWN